MIATHPSQFRNPPARENDQSLARHWGAVHDAAEAVTMLACVEPEVPNAKIRAFAMLIRDLAAWQRELAGNNIEDMTAMMQPGLAALLATRARGQDASIPARALLREFYAARDAVLALLPEPGALGPRRSA